MAFRMVYGSFWTDPRVMEQMTQDDKFFYLYILTNPSTTSCGIYMITKKQIAFEMGHSIEIVNTLMDRFENQYKLITYNKETWELAIKNWGKHNLSRGGKPMMDCLVAELGRVKDKNLIKYVQEHIKNKVMRDLFESFCDKDSTVSRDVPPQGDNINIDTKREINTDTDINKNTQRDTDTRINTSEEINISGNIDTSKNTSASLNTEIDEVIQSTPRSEESAYKSSGTYVKEEESHNLSLTLIQEYEKVTGHIGLLKLAALKIAVTQHGYSNVKKAINKALEKGKLTMSYVNGILRTWAIEGYPREDETNGNGSTNKNTGYGKNEFAGFKPPEPTQLTEEERKELEGELL